ncbi:MAG: CCA tRNA nucleotidyltransferase [Oscillospiraceae bacterium]|nr:CCA tRNA nucleotidyltransferase [Oscillospiraceae bacterium]
MEKLDPRALTILSRLEQAGHQAVLVGGCVRDLLLGRHVHDYDIATSALPEQVCALFSHTVPTGLRHGTVTVLLDDGSYELTTFRTEGAYLDHRRPEAVQYVQDLSEDLSRRDFTINAMAMDRHGVVTDLFQGQADLQAGLIRCVGDPDLRFSEDALRMLRAVRFSAQLDFRIEARTLASAQVLAPTCAALSAERVRDEMEKALLSPHPEAIGQMMDLGLLAHLGLREHPELSPLSSVPPERLARWAMAKRLLPQLDLTTLRLDKKAVRLSEAAAALTDMDTLLACKQAIAEKGWEAARLAAVLNGQLPRMEEIAASGDCVTIPQLAIRGDELPGLSGPEVAQTLHRLLQHVLEHPEDNQKERLLALLKK